MPGSALILNLGARRRVFGGERHAADETTAASQDLTRATAKVNVQRKDGKILVEIEDLISPSIIERLKEQAGILSPQIDDWRSMVDTVMIDSAYNGEVFNIVLADVPERKDDLVAGSYELDAPRGETTVAVKISDMLGEEILVTQIV